MAPSLVLKGHEKMGRVRGDQTVAISFAILQYFEIWIHLSSKIYISVYDYLLC